MSLAQRVDRGDSVVRQIDMGAPGSLDIDVTLTDLQTGDRFWTNTRQNFIIDITNLVDPAATIRYLVTTQRNGKETKRWYSSNLLNGFGGESRAGFPVSLRPGQLNWVGQQQIGALTATSYLVTLQHDL